MRRSGQGGDDLGRVRQGREPVRRPAPIAALVHHFCDYETGMGGDLDAGLNEDARRDLTAHHEAGHAVVSYAVGFGCAEIMLTTEIRFLDGRLQCRHEGGHKPNQKAVWRIDRRRSRRRFNSDLLALGIATAAGPAAQRSFCIARGYMPSNYTNVEDRKQIDQFAESIATPARSRFVKSAYRRLVWRRAQLAVAEPRISLAITEVAGALNDLWPDVPSPGEITVTMHGAKVRQVARRSGVAIGMLNESVREISNDAWMSRLIRGLGLETVISTADRAAFRLSPDHPPREPKYG